eukprot:m51a1_g4932 hypothetical protein (195) ;mRNA; r:270237-270882
MTLRWLGDLAGRTETRVPLVGPLTNWHVLRDPERVVGGDGRVSVVNLRAGGHEEFSAIVSFLWRELDALDRTAVVMGVASPESSLVEFVRAELESIGSIVDKILLPGGSAKGNQTAVPFAVVLSATDALTVQIIEGMAARGARGVTYVCGSDVDETVSHILLSPETRNGLASLESTVYYVQHAPLTTAQSELIR